MGMLICGFLITGSLVCASAVGPNLPDVCSANAQCGPNEYCAKPVGNCWAPGVCAPRPVDVPPCWEPVCGCNGATYPNGWVAAMLGMNLRYAWACNAGDLNHDGHVDAADLDAFGICMRGPDLIYTDSCAEADTDYDHDVDLADYVVPQLMASPAAAVASISHSGCKAVNTEPGDWCVVDDSFVIFPSPGSLHILHFNVTYNCCLTGIAITVDVQEDLIAIQETEVVEIPCFCLCCYDVGVTIVNLQPGAYNVRYCWRDSDMGGIERCIEIPVVIP